MELQLILDGRHDLVGQLYRQLRDAILHGRLATGDRLPATRYLAERLEVSRKTVSEAYERLTSEGFLEGRVGSGTFVARGPAAAARRRSAAAGRALDTHRTAVRSDGPASTAPLQLRRRHDRQAPLSLRYLAYLRAPGATPATALAGVLQGNRRRPRTAPGDLPLPGDQPRRAVRLERPDGHPGRPAGTRPAGPGDARPRRPGGSRGTRLSAGPRQPAGHRRRGARSAGGRRGAARRPAAGQRQAGLRHPVAPVPAGHADEPGAAPAVAGLGAAPPGADHRGRLRQRVPLRRAFAGVAAQPRPERPGGLPRDLFQDPLPRACASATCCRRQACAKRCWRRASWSTGTARPCSNAPSRCSSSAATSPAIRAACNANTPSVAGACWNACTAT